MRWELWQPKDLDSEEPTNDFFFPEDHEQLRRFAEEDEMVCTWTVEAEDKASANQALYDHMGWGKYSSMEDEPDK